MKCTQCEKDAQYFKQVQGFFGLGTQFTDLILEARCKEHKDSV